MNKKGFTLIEIIVCVVLISVVGGATFFSIKILNNNVTKKKLSEIEDKIYEAVNIYIETKTESKKQLYEKNNAVVIPLNVLKNEGLMDFGNIDIKGHSVLTVLGSPIKEDSCIDTAVVGTWTKDDSVIYLCTDGVGTKMSELEKN